MSLAPHDIYTQACDEALGSFARSMADPHQWAAYLNNGGGERAIAGDHHGRHLLELLQNARDAVHLGRQRGAGARGRVLVGATEQGLIVANSGAPFPLHQQREREAVQYLQKSSKESAGFVGHKGIGLKSVLLRFGGFHVRSHVSEDCILRAAFSRSRTALGLLATLDQGPLPGIDALGLPDPAVTRRSFADPWPVLAELPRLPLFLQPHVDLASGGGVDGDLLEDLLVDKAPKRRAAEGLDAMGQPAELDGYTTVVWLPYRDHAWERLLETLGPLVPDAQREAWQRALAIQRLMHPPKPERRTWREINELDPRAFMLLGEVSELQLCHFQQGRLKEAVRYDLERPLLVGRRAPGELGLQRVSWKLRRKNLPPQKRRFLVWSRKLRSESEPVRVLAEVPPRGASADHSLPETTHPLYLFYPIENLGLSLPLLVHGPFRVNSARTDLADEDEHNGRVLETALALIQEALEGLGRRRDPTLQGCLPWVVTPRRPLGQPRRPLLQGFTQQVASLLREAPIVPTQMGLRPGAEVLFDPSRPAAFDMLPRGASLHPRSRACFEALRARDPEHAGFAAASIGLGDILGCPQPFGDALIQAWEGLDNRLGVKVKFEVGRAWFATLAAALGSMPDKTRGSLAARLGEAQIPLVPARQGRGLLLVRAQPRVNLRDLQGEEPAANRDGSPRLERVVFWRDRDARDRLKKLPPPPAGIEVFLAEKEDLGNHHGLLDEHGRDWGTTRLQGAQDLFLRVANQMVGSAAAEVVRVLPWLVARLAAVRGSDDGRLASEPGAWRGWPRRASVRPSSDPASRGARRRYAEVARLGTLRLPNRSGGDSPARVLVMGPAWAALLVACQSERGIDWARAVQEYGRFASLSPNTKVPWLADPDDPRWGRALPAWGWRGCCSVSACRWAHRCVGAGCAPTTGLLGAMMRRPPSLRLPPAAGLPSSP